MILNLIDPVVFRRAEGRQVASFSSVARSGGTFNSSRFAAPAISCGLAGRRRFALRPSTLLRRRAGLPEFPNLRQAPGFRDSGGAAAPEKRKKPNSRVAAFGLHTEAGRIDLRRCTVLANRWLICRCLARGLGFSPTGTPRELPERHHCVRVVLMANPFLKAWGKKCTNRQA